MLVCSYDTYSSLLTGQRKGNAMYKFQWYEDEMATDPYNRHVADIPGYPDWRIKRKWDGSRNEVSVQYRRMHVGYSKRDYVSVLQFIDQYTKH